MSSEILKPNSVTIIAMKSNSDKRQMMTAMPFGNFFFSIQLQKGKNKVANMPPTQSGIKKSLAK
jgi:hypothetical protein